MADGETKPKHKPKADFDARATAEMEQHLAVPDWSLRQKLALTARMLAREEHGSALAGRSPPAATIRRRYGRRASAWGWRKPAPPIFCSSMTT